MSYSVLARKWRPSTFDEVIGQEAVIKTLKNSIKEGRIHHSLIFSGLRGTGKTSTARIYAKALNCEQGPTVEPCGKCNQCVEIAEGRDIDVMEIDAASNKGVDDIRNLKEIVQYPPVRDRFRVFIIDEVHMLSTHAFNALLKTIEEPPSYVVFILATTEPHKIPATIRSRCQIFEFKKIPYRFITEHLKRICSSEKISIEDKALQLIVDASEGSMRDAQSLLDQIVSFTGGSITEEDVSFVLGVPDSSVFFKVFEAVVKEDLSAIVKLMDMLEERNTDFVKFAFRLGEFLNNSLHALVSGNSDFFPDGLSSEKFTVEDIVRYLNVVLQNEKFIRESYNPRIAVELLLFKMVYAKSVVPISELISKKKPKNLANAVQILERNKEKESRVNNGDSREIEDFVKNSLKQFEEFALLFENFSIAVKEGEILLKTDPLPNVVKERLEKTVFKSLEGNLAIKFKKRYRLRLQCEPLNTGFVSETEKIANHPLIKHILETFDGKIEKIKK